MKNNFTKYKQLFQKEGINITDEELDEVINNIDSMGNLLFQKYKKEVLEK